MSKIVAHQNKKVVFFSRLSLDLQIEWWSGWLLLEAKIWIIHNDLLACRKYETTVPNDSYRF
jgi:hypothetical protein